MMCANQMNSHKVLRRLIVLLILVTSASAMSETLVSINTDAIVSLPQDDSISRLMVVDGQAVAIGEHSTWILDESEQRWELAIWKPEEKILGLAGDGIRTFLILGSEDDGSANRVEKLSLQESRLESSVLSSIPVALSSAQGAMLSDRLFVSGTSKEGVPQFLEIDVSADKPEWIIHDA